MSTSVLSRRVNDLSTIPRYLVNQDIEVRIKANVWIVGVIVGVCQLLQKVAGIGYEVEYSTSSGINERGRFPPSDIRPRD